MGQRTKHIFDGLFAISQPLKIVHNALLPAALAGFMALLLLYSWQIKPARHFFTKYRSRVYDGGVVT